MAIGDFGRRGASRERLRERPRMRCVIAPKKSREVGDAGDAGGDMLPDDCDFCESTVLVRIGGTGWKLVWL